MMVQDSAGAPEKETNNVKATIPETKLAEDFELLGDWMTVTKRKKKPPSNQGRKSVPGSKGASYGKPVHNKEVNKSKESDVVNSMRKVDPVFVMGITKPITQVAPQENKKRRFRTSEADKAGGTQVMASSSKDPPNDSTWEASQLESMVFGQTMQAGEIEDDYNKRIGANGLHDSLHIQT